MSVFQCKTKVVTGTGALEMLRTIRAERVLLVTDPYFSGSGIGLKLAGMIPDAVVTVFDQVVPNPSAELAAQGAAVCVRIQPQVLLAVGGGSVIDCAKGIRAACERELLFIAVPTTSGSGSEMTSYAVLTRNHVKYPLVDESLLPDITILDDSLLRGLPTSLIADTGMDMLAHCMEAIVATGRSGFTDALAVHGVRTVFQSLRKSFQGDQSVRLQLHEAASMAGVSFNHAGLGLCHALAHSIGGAFSIPHGRLCAILLPAVISCNAEYILEPYAYLAKCYGLAAPTERLSLRNLLAEICRLRRELRLPENLWQTGIDRKEWENKRTDIVLAAVQDPCCKTNPVPVTEVMVSNVLKAVAP